jgi:hypothetical protein
MRTSIVLYPPTLIRGGTAVTISSTASGSDAHEGKVTAAAKTHASTTFMPLDPIVDGGQAGASDAGAWMAPISAT